MADTGCIGGGGVRPMEEGYLILFGAITLAICLYLHKKEQALVGVCSEQTGGRVGGQA